MTTIASWLASIGGLDLFRRGASELDGDVHARQLDKSLPEPLRPADAHNFRRSLQELRLFRSQFPNAVITPGHRGKQKYE